VQVRAGPGAAEAAEQQPAQQQQPDRLHEAERVPAEQVRREPVPQTHHGQAEPGHSQKD